MAYVLDFKGDVENVRAQSRARLGRRIATLALSLGASLALAELPSRGQCTLPPAPGAGTTDSSFDSLMMQNGPGWTGADGTYSIALPDGKDLWLWSDSYIGTVNPQTRLRSSYLFQAHNSLTLQDPSTRAWTTVGYSPTTTSSWYWPGGELLYQPAPGVYKIKVMLLKWTGLFKFLGDSVATLSYPSLSVDSIVPVALPDLSIEWGSKLLQDGGFYYIYGIKDPGTANKLPYVARTTSIDNLTQPSEWQYWSATQGKWLSSQSSATPLSGVPAITNEYSVDKLTASTGPFYLMVGMDPQAPPYPLWKYVTTYYSCSPQGPWTTRTVVYTTPETGAAGCSVGTLYTYNPKAHVEFTDSAGVLVSYNVNANDSKDLVCANDYIPRFIRVPIAGVSSLSINAPESPPRP